MSLAVLGAMALLQTEAPISVNLTRSLRGLDFEATKERRQMYLPSAAPLAKEAPKGLKKGPKESSESLLYGSLKVGNGSKSEHLFVLSVSAAGTKLFVDLNQNLDLSDDAPSDWKKVESANGPSSWQGTVFLTASYKSGSREWKAPYSLNLYWAEGRETLNYYRATQLEGSFKYKGKNVSVRLYEDGNDGVFSRRFDLVEDPLLAKPVTLVLNETPKDARGTFDFEGINFLVEISPDGSSLKLQPTVRSIKPPVRTAASQAKPLLAPKTPAPDFAAEKPEGGQIQLSDYRGKVVVLKFWATWCGPCIASMPHYEELYEKTKGKDVALLAVCVSDEKAAFSKWVEANKAKYTFPFYFDPAGRTPGQSISSRLYNVTGIPTVYIIDKEGKVAESVVGYTQGDDRVNKALERLGVVL